MDLGWAHGTGQRVHRVDLPFPQSVAGGRPTRQASRWTRPGRRGPGGRLLAKSPAPAKPRHTPDDLAKLAGTAQGSLPAAKDARETERHNTLLRQLLEAARGNPELRGNAFRLHGLAKWYSEHFRPPLPAAEVQELYGAHSEGEFT